MSLILDDKGGFAKPQIAINEYGTWRSNGKTERELLKEYREKFGEERYKTLKEKIAKSKEM